MKNKSNKIIAFILSMVMILSNILPNISNIVFAATETIEPVVEYSDSGQTLPEREITETDLDNFNLYLDYGTISDKVSGDTLFVKDQSNKINATLRIEYRGNQSYNAGDLSMTFNYPTGIYRNNPDYDMLSDVGAELIGSGSGRGDWYYEKELGKLTFTNKQATTGSFTSSIEIVLDMPSIRYVINKFSSTMNASFSINGIDSVLDSETLYFSAETTHDEHTLVSLESKEYIYETESEDSSTYEVNGFSLDEYYITTFRAYDRTTKYNRGFDATVTYTVPDDCIIINNNNNTSTYTYRTKNYSEGYAGYHYINVAIPKSKYNAGDKINLTWDIEEVFFDTNETDRDSLSAEVEILDTKINIKGYIVITNKKASVDTIYRDSLDDNGTDFYWSMTLKRNPIYQINPDYAPKHTEVVDNKTWLSKNEEGYINYKIEDFTEDEYYLTYIKFIPEGQNIDGECNFKVYAKKNTDTEYTLVNDFIFNGSEVTVDLDPEQRYYNFKVEIDGDWGVYSSINIQTGAHLNQFSIEDDEYKNKEKLYLINKMDYTETLNNGDVNTITYEKNGLNMAQIEIRNNIIYPESMTFRIDGYSLKDSKILFEGTYEGYYKLFSEKKNYKVHNLSFDISIPSYMEFDMQSFEKSITPKNSSGLAFEIDQTIYNESDDTPVPYKYDYGHPNNYCDIDYEIINNGTQKTLKVNVKTKDGYYMSTQYVNDNLGLFRYYFDYYMDFDTYSLLKSMGKLPSYHSISATNYKCEDISNGLIWTDTYKKRGAGKELPSLAGNTYQGVEKFVNTGSGFTKDLSATTPEGDYSYKLRIAGGETTLDNIVLYDNLEETYGDNSYWKGTFNGIDTTILDMIYEGEAYNYTIYYSKNKNQVFDLSDAGWINEADWTDALSDVKSIAVDLGGIKLEPKSFIYVIINMKAPEDSYPGLKAYNSYAADYKAYDPKTGIQMEDIKALPSNTTEVIYNKNITYTVNKIWDGKDGSSARVRLLANGIGKEMTTLNADNAWTYTFIDLPAFDDSFSPIEYIVEEIPISRYEASYKTTTDTNGNITTDITNTKLPDDVYTFTKKWNVDDSDDAIESFILKPFDSNIMSFDEQVALRAGIEFVITASGKGLKDTTFTVVGNEEDGAFKIPGEYAKYSDLSFELKDKKGLTYTCHYVIEKSNPHIPNQITLKASKPGRDESGNITDKIILTKDNNWTAKYYFDRENIAFKEGYVNGWSTGTGNNGYNGLAITFDENFETETYNPQGGSGDYLDIFYKSNNQIYKFGRYSGNSLAGKTLKLPSTDVYFHWHTGSKKNNHYGFKVTDIENTHVTIPSKQTKATLPNYDIEELEGSNYPDSAFDIHTHKSYGEYIDKIWHYKYDLSGDNISIIKKSDNDYSVEIINKSGYSAKVIFSEIEEKPTINYTVIKKWKNVEFPVPVIINLMANGKVKSTVNMQEFKNNEQAYTFKDLPMYDENGKEIEYSVVEKNIFDEMEYMDWIWYWGGMEYENLLYEYFNNKDGNVPDTQEYINSIYNNPNLSATQEDYITNKTDRVTVITNEISTPTNFIIKKIWNINSEKIKFNVKTENGYDAEYDHINILDENGNILERIDFEKLGLIVSNNEYKTDKTYIAEVHMKDGKVYKTSVNIDKFTKSPVECDLYVDGEVVDTFTLNEENGWKYTVTPSEKNNTNAISLYSDDIIIVNPGDNPGGDDGEPHEYIDLDGVCAICGKTKKDRIHSLPELPTNSHSIKEKTAGEWESVIKYTEDGNNIEYTITNNVQHEIKISTIIIPNSPEIVDTGNNNYLWIYLVILGIGLTGIFFSRKKKQ